MTDEALIEKMAEAMWNGSDGPEEWLSWASLGDDSKDRIRHCARAALSVVREHDKKGLVHADSTSAERSSDQSAGKRYAIIQDIGETFFEGMLEKQPGDKIEDLHCSTVDYAAERVLEILKEYHWPTDDRSAPAAPREPDLPKSLLSKMESQGGLTKGKRS